MKKFFKLLGALVGLVVLAAGILIGIGRFRMYRTYSIEPAPLEVSASEEMLQRGRYLANTGCTDCHGEDLRGTVMIDDPALGYFPAPNLTSGSGGIGSRYAGEDWVRAIRHGISQNGTPLMIMPSKAFYHFSDADLAAVIAYARSVPAVDNDLGEKKPGIPGYLLLALGAFGEILSAEHIAHTTPPPPAPSPGINPAYGEYLVNITGCRGCHGEGLNGAVSSEPGAPPSPNLTPGGNLGSWTPEQFVQTIRTGTTPGGVNMDENFMPWEYYRRLTDDDLNTIYLYLASLAPAESGIGE